MGTLGIIGECMLEFHEAGENFALGYGGDVFNTGVYAARLNADVQFFSATGDDYFSDYLLDAWEKEGVQTSNSVRIIPGFSPSLYIIKTDESGERSFHYWRDASPFKQLLGDGAYLRGLPEMLEACQFVFYSGISLALLSPADRVSLLQHLNHYRKRGGKVGFDSNYRPRLWQSAADALTWIDRAYAECDIALPSLDDESLLRANTTEPDFLKNIQNLGVHEIAMKNGASGATVFANGQTHKIAANEVSSVVDTTAAGDSFNGAYLASRLNGDSATNSAKTGCKVASQVIQHHGAIISSSVPLTEAQEP